MSNGKSKRRRLFKLWEEDPRCYYCKLETVLIMRPPSLVSEFDGVKTHLREATIEHLRHRMSDDRGSDSNEATVLACRECNHKKGVEAEIRHGKYMLHPGNRGGVRSEHDK